jgi:hypothetical protein
VHGRRALLLQTLKPEEIAGDYLPSEAGLLTGAVMVAVLATKEKPSSGGGESFRATKGYKGTARSNGSCKPG